MGLRLCFKIIYLIPFKALSYSNDSPPPHSFILCYRRLIPPPSLAENHVIPSQEMMKFPSASWQLQCLKKPNRTERSHLEQQRQISCSQLSQNAKSTKIKIFCVRLPEKTVVVTNPVTKKLRRHSFVRIWKVEFVQNT